MIVDFERFMAHLGGPVLVALTLAWGLWAGTR